MVSQSALQGLAISILLKSDFSFFIGACVFLESARQFKHFTAGQPVHTGFTLDGPGC
jgi:hypothetical protein